MTFERTFDIYSAVFECDTCGTITLTDPLCKQLSYPEQLLLTGLPNSHHHSARRNPGTGAYRLRRCFLRRLREVFLHTLKQCIDMFPDVLGIIFFDNLLERGFRVATVGGDFRWGGGLEKTFDSFKVFLDGTACQ